MLESGTVLLASSPSSASSSPGLAKPQEPLPLLRGRWLHSLSLSEIHQGKGIDLGPMESGPSLLCLLFLLLPSHSQAKAAAPWHRRLEYKFSFKGPRLAIAGQGIPFWSHHGDAIPGLQEVRLAPSMRNKRGAMWTQAAIPFPNWEVEVAFHVSGLGRLGAEGMAVWYARDRGQTGPVFGGPAFWDGIGILFDSFDNDNQNNPAIQVLANDGQIPYDHLRDGGGQVLGSCVRDFRNRLYPFQARITYWEEKLWVYINNGLTAQGAIDEVCTEVGPLLLPPGGFFGVSAATGTLADDHDVLSFLTFSLSKPAPEALPYVIPESEQHRLKHQLQDLQKELKHQKETSPKPELASPFWGEGSLDLELTLKRHSQVLEELQDLSGKMAQTVGQWRSQMQFLGHPDKEMQEADGAQGATSEKMPKWEGHSDISHRYGPVATQSRVEMASPEQILGCQDQCTEPGKRNGRAGSAQVCPAGFDLQGAQLRINSAAVRILLHGQQTLLQNMQEMRAAAARITSKAEVFYLPVGTEHHFQELHQILALLQRDVESLLHLPKHAAKASSSHAGRVLCLSRGIFLLFLLIQTGCAFYCLLFRWETDRSLRECFSKNSLVLALDPKQLFRRLNRVARQDSLTP
ncbi:protein ERGIC-53-like [Dromiciops gliroides]|uniref:protein ERGIC-53-like n=1 Tax=Dromiciops gliroides TaxID=33562 RepID=UPI001CC3A5A3|nr:protein ERGIC-53-like [Dromiciops gliroides]